MTDFELGPVLFTVKDPAAPPTPFFQLTGVEMEPETITGKTLVNAWGIAMGPTMRRLHAVRKAVRQTWVDGWREEILGRAGADENLVSGWRASALRRAQALVTSACLCPAKRFGLLGWPEPPLRVDILRFRSFSILLETHRLLKMREKDSEYVEHLVQLNGTYPELFGSFAATADLKLHDTDLTALGEA